MRRRRELKFVELISPKPMPEEDRRIAEDLLAEFIARAYIARTVNGVSHSIPSPRR